MTLELTLKNNVPSKKNNRFTRWDGRSVPSTNFVQWQNHALWQVRQQTRHRFLKPVSIEIIIYFGSNARADLDNKVTSILDMLVEALVLPDDKWQAVPMIKAQAEYRKADPGAFIRITELS